MPHSNIRESLMNPHSNIRESLMNPHSNIPQSPINPHSNNPSIVNKSAIRNPQSAIARFVGVGARFQHETRHCAFEHAASPARL
jgi:hypothetical protein